MTLLETEEQVEFHVICQQTKLPSLQNKDYAITCIQITGFLVEEEIDLPLNPHKPGQELWTAGDMDATIAIEEKDFSEVL